MRTKINDNTLIICANKELRQAVLERKKTNIENSGISEENLDNFREKSDNYLKRIRGSDTLVMARCG